MTTANNKPDFNIYTQSGDGNNAPLRQIGAAWKHRTGEGFNIVLFATPVSGTMVAFPPKEKVEDIEF